MPNVAPSSSMQRSLAETDPEIAGAIRHEVGRQSAGLELIASENFVSAAILEAAGSVMTNKYAEGYPGRRYYGGGAVVGLARTLAIAPAPQRFCAAPPHTPPHTSAPAPTAAFPALLRPRGT